MTWKYPDYRVVLIFKLNCTVHLWKSGDHHMIVMFFAFLHVAGPCCPISFDSTFEQEWVRGCGTQPNTPPLLWLNVKGSVRADSVTFLFTCSLECT